MQIYMFTSEVSSALHAFAGDPSGSKLPRATALERGRFAEVRSTSAIPVLQGEDRRGYQDCRVSTLAPEVYAHAVRGACRSRGGGDCKTPVSDLQNQRI